MFIQAWPGGSRWGDLVRRTGRVLDIVPHGAHAMTTIHRRGFLAGAGLLGLGIASAPTVRLLPATPAKAAHEMVTLDDYRLRYASYRTDPDLQRVHQLFPVVHTWDDHESTNDSWTGGAQNHQPDAEGPWEDRKRSAARACQEWLPKRLIDGEPLRIYRTLPFGDLADLIVMDTRLDERDLAVSATADTARRLGRRRDPGRQPLHPDGRRGGPRLPGARRHR